MLYIQYSLPSLIQLLVRIKGIIRCLGCRTGAVAGDVLDMAGY
jgi:hypothetical protein